MTLLKDIAAELSDYTEVTARTYAYSGNPSDADKYILPHKLVNTVNAQTIAGIKTFSSFPITPSAAPTTDYQVANKKYVDDLGIDDILAIAQALTADRQIDIGSNTLTLSKVQGSETLLLTLNKGGLKRYIELSYTHTDNRNATFYGDNGGVLMKYIDAASNVSQIDYNTSTGWTLTDEIDTKGLTEAADYSAQKTDYSYVTKTYTDLYRPTTEPAVVTGTPNELTLDLSSKRHALFEPRLSVGTRTINVDFDLILSNSSNANLFGFILSLSGTRIITMPSDVKISNPSTIGTWDDIGKTLTLLSGTDDIIEFQAIYDNTGSQWLLKISEVAE